MELHVVARFHDTVIAQAEDASGDRTSRATHPARSYNHADLAAADPFRRDDVLAAIRVLEDEDDRFSGNSLLVSI